MAEKHELGSGIEYPKVTIDGAEYTVKFSRAALYRLDKAGFDLRALPDQLRSWLPRSKSEPGHVRLSVLTDVMHAALGSQINCTAEELAEKLDPERTAEYCVSLIVAISKMRPPSNQGKLQEAAANQTAQRMN